MRLLLEACPSFSQTWATLEHDEIHADGAGRLHYLDAMEFANHMVALYEAGADDEVAASLAVIERLHLEGDAFVRELATIGYLEDVHGSFVTRPAELERLGSLLGPESARWWRGLQAFWNGENPSVVAVDGPT